MTDEIIYDNNPSMLLNIANTRQGKILIVTDKAI